MAAESESVADQIACHVKQCTEPATYFCDRCARAYCAGHIRHISIERRQTHGHAGSGLARLPTYTETYCLCTSCWKKPVPGKQPQLMP